MNNTEINISFVPLPFRIEFEPEQATADKRYYEPNIDLVGSDSLSGANKRLLLYTQTVIEAIKAIKICIYIACAVSGTSIFNKELREK